MATLGDVGEGQSLYTLTMAKLGWSYRKAGVSLILNSDVGVWRPVGPVVGWIYYT